MCAVLQGWWLLSWHCTKLIIHEDGERWKEGKGGRERERLQDTLREIGVIPLHCWQLLDHKMSLCSTDKCPRIACAWQLPSGDMIAVKAGQWTCYVGGGWGNCVWSRIIYSDTEIERESPVITLKGSLGSAGTPSSLIHPRVKCFSVAPDFSSTVCSEIV